MFALIAIPILIQKNVCTDCYLYLDTKSSSLIEFDWIRLDYIELAFKDREGEDESLLFISWGRDHSGRQFKRQEITMNERGEEEGREDVGEAEIFQNIFLFTYGEIKNMTQ